MGVCYNERYILVKNVTVVSASNDLDRLRLKAEELARHSDPMDFILIHPGATYRMMQHRVPETVSIVTRRDPFGFEAQGDAAESMTLNTEPAAVKTKTLKSPKLKLRERLTPHDWWLFDENDEPFCCALPLEDLFPRMWKQAKDAVPIRLVLSSKRRPGVRACERGPLETARIGQPIAEWSEQQFEQGEAIWWWFERA